MVSVLHCNMLFISPPRGQSGLQGPSVGVMCHSALTSFGMGRPNKGMWATLQLDGVHCLKELVSLSSPLAIVVVVGRERGFGKNRPGTVAPLDKRPSGFKFAVHYWFTQVVSRTERCVAEKKRRLVCCRCARGVLNRSTRYIHDCVGGP